jgi:TIR domain
VPDVFISYSKLDREEAARLAADLQWRGLDVWWDTNLYASQHYPSVILQGLDQSKIAIVIWSTNSVKSDWVRNEANKAHLTRKLIPTYLPPFDLKDIPLGLDELHTLDVNQRYPLYAVIRRFGLVVHEPKIPGYPFALDPDVPLVQQVEASKATLPPGLEDNWATAEEILHVINEIEKVRPDYAADIQTVRKGLPYAFYEGSSAVVSLILIRLAFADGVTEDQKLCLQNAIDFINLARGQFS